MDARRVAAGGVVYQKRLALRVVLEEVAARATERRAAGKEEAPAPRLTCLAISASLLEPKLVGVRRSMVGEEEHNLPIAGVSTLCSEE